MKTVIKGSGITAYAVTQTENDEELRAWFRAMSKRKGTDGFEFALGDEMEAWWASILADATPAAIQTEHSLAWYAKHVLRYISFVRAEIGRGDAPQAAARAMRLGELLAEAFIKFHWETAALTGQKFTAGRKHGAGGPIRKAIARLLKQRLMKNRELWDTLASRPPGGWTFYDNKRIGKYIEGPKAGDNMGYARFSNVAKEERDKL